VTPDEFTKGLAHYLKYQGPRTHGVSFEVVKAFVKNGANPLVRRSGDDRDLFEIALHNKWSNASLLELNEIVNLYEQHSIIKSSSSIPVPKAFIQEFDQEVEALSAVINQFKKKTNSPFKFEQDYRSACIAGEELLRSLAKHRSDYKERKITMDEFRTHCGANIKAALQTDLAKQHVIYRALVSFSNFIVGLTIVIPIATKITTGRWGLFTNSETKSEEHLRKIEDNLRRLAEPADNGFASAEQKSETLETEKMQPPVYPIITTPVSQSNIETRSVYPELPSAPIIEMEDLLKGSDETPLRSSSQDQVSKHPAPSPLNQLSTFGKKPQDNSKSTSLVESSSPLQKRLG
jgi:hypothetical protein